MSTGVSATPDVTQANIGRLDAVVGIARANGVDGRVEVSIPHDAVTAFVVSQTRGPWVLSTSSIAVQGNGTVVDTNRFADWPVAAKLAAWGIALHMGILFGVANQVALALLAAALVTVVVRGYLMWWRRRPFAPAPPARGGVRALPTWRLAMMIVGTALVGWFVPLLGISLLAFLLIDALLGLRHSQTSESK